LKSLSLRLPLCLRYLFGHQSDIKKSENGRPSGMRCRRAIQGLEILEDRVAAGSMLPLPGVPGPWSDLALASALGTDLSPSPAVYYPPRQDAAAAGALEKPPDNPALAALSVLGRQGQDSRAGTDARGGGGLQDLDAQTVDEIFGGQAGGLETSPDADSLTSADPGTGGADGAPFIGPASHPTLSAGAGSSMGAHAGAGGLTTSALGQPLPGGTPGQPGMAANQGLPGGDHSSPPPPQPPGNGDTGSDLRPVPPVPPSTAYTGYIGSTTLLNLFQNYTSSYTLTTAQKLTFQFDQHNGMERVLVNVRALPSANLSQMQQNLQNLVGMTVTTVTPGQNLITGYLPIVNIHYVTGVPGFAALTPVYAPLHFGTTSGDSVIKADVFRSTTGLNGAGVTVGDLSDSINQGLPPDAGVNVLKDGTATDTNEGRAMLDVVHQVAPGASLAFNTSDGGPQAMAQGIVNLATQAHAQVIVDDTAYPNEPFFSNGVITQAVNQVAVNNNVNYVTAAGNEGNQAWSDAWRPVMGGTFRPPAPMIPPGTFENFSSTPGQVNWLQNFTLPVGQTLNLAFQWDAAYLEGGTDQGRFQVPNEIDVQIRDSTGFRVLKLFNDDTRNTAEALQRVVFTNDGSYGTTNFAMSFQLVNGPAPTTLKWVRFDNGPPAQYQGGSTIFGHAAAADALTVGAVPVSNPTQAEPFSSQGGTVNYFDSYGRRLARPQVNKLKPDLVGPDQVQTNTFPVFTGTSAAAAHLAGAAALLREQNPTSPFGSIDEQLKLSAKPVGSASPNLTTGSGLAQLSPLAPLPQPTRQLINIGPPVPISNLAQNIVEEAITIDPLNPQLVFADANPADTLLAGLPGFFVAYSTNGGATWTQRIIGNGLDGLPQSAGDPTCSWDEFGNLFVGYLDFVNNTADVLLSTDGGVSFRAIAALPAMDQSTIVTGAGMVWDVFNNLDLEAAGAAVTGLGQVGAFTTNFSVPNSFAGNFGDIAIGPNGQVIVTFQHADSGIGPDTISVSVKADGLGSGAFSAPVVATTTNVGGFDPITPQPNRTIDAEAGLAFDRSTGPRRGRVYLMYTDAPFVGSDNTNIFVRFSDDNGASWSSPVQVNDDTTNNSHFLPRIALDQATGNIAVSWLDARLDQGQGPPNDRDGLANTDVQEVAAVSLDGGLDFSGNIQVSTGPSNAATFGADGGFDFGDYTGLAFFNNTFYPAWPDNSLTLPGGHSPIFTLATAKVTIPSGEDQFEPNETSDKATNMGTLNAGTVTFSPLTITRHANGLPDYDWYRWTVSKSGTVTVNLDVLGDLELHVFTVTGNNTLVDLGDDPGALHRHTRTVSVQVTAGEALLVEVKGKNSVLGVHENGVYAMHVTLA
jgi:hypothetical protein